MTKEELKQEAEEYAEERCKDCYMCSADGKRNKCHFYTKRVEAYIASAESREKRIAELEERISNQGESLRVTMLEEEKKEKRIAELEAQIEEMKCCSNCKNYSPTYGLCCYSLGDEDYDCRLRKWEIKEK